MEPRPARAALPRLLSWMGSRDRAALLALALLSGLALFTRFWAINHKSLFLDEAVSWQYANTSLRRMFDLTAHDQHPPLYYGILHYWVRFADNSEVALRAPSAMFGAATIVLVGLTSWRIGGWMLSAVVSLLLLANGPYLAATQEARMYALESLLAISSSLALASFVTRPSALRFASYAALAVLLIYTHYSGFIVIGAQGVVFGVYGLHRLARERSAWIIIAGLALLAVLSLAYVPWWSTFRTHARVGVGHIPQPTMALVKDASRSLLGLDEAKGGWLVLALPLLGFGAYGLIKRWREPKVLSLGSVALVPVGQILVSVWFKPVFDVRYAAPLIPGLAFVCALGFVEAIGLSRHLRKFAPMAYATVLAFGIAAAVLIGIGLAQTYRGPPFQDWRGVAADLHGAPVFFAPGYQAQPLEYYRGSTFGLSGLYDVTARHIGQGFMPIHRANMNEKTFVVLQGARGHALLPSIKTYFDVQVLHDYPGWITAYELRPFTTAEYNVVVFSGYTTGEWTVTPDGYLQTVSDKSHFSLLSPSDKDHANGVDEDYVLHVEYLDQGPPSFALVGLTSGGQVPFQLASATIDGTAEWKSLDVAVKKGSALGDVFYLTAGVTIRTLEMRRYELGGVTVLRSSADPARHWFLRTDGYLESTATAACDIEPTEAPAAGAKSRLTFTWLYSGDWIDSDVNYSPGSSSCLPAWPYGFIVRRIALSPAG